MVGFIKLLLGFIRDWVSLRERLAAENLVLRHQLNILRRNTPKRLRLFDSDRALFAGLYGLRPSILSALAIVQPETVIRWHRAGWRAWWRWKSRNRGGRPTIGTELRDLIRQMCRDNPLWGAPRIHGELLKLGFDVAQSTVSKYMVRRRGPPSQGWKTFLRNHADGVASIDLFTVATIGFVTLCFHRSQPRPAQDPVVWRHQASDGRMAGATDHRSFSLGYRAGIPDPRQRPGLWRCLPQTGSSHGHTRSPDHPKIAMAKWSRRARHRFDPQRMPRSCDRHGRRTSAVHPRRLHKILQRRADASCNGQRFSKR